MRAFQFLFAVILSSPEGLADHLRQRGANGIQVHRAQLDGDAPLEVVIQYELPDSGVHAIVLDSHGSEWREAGKFNSWWNFTPADSGNFLEFRETVETGVKDLIVRTRGGGTEESGTTLEIFRFRDGAMVNVLTLTESLSAMEHPSGDVLTTTAEFTYGPGRVTAKLTTNPGNRQTCRSYIWNAVRFRFDEDSPCG